MIRKTILLRVSLLFTLFLFLLSGCGSRSKDADGVSGATWKKDSVEKPPLAVEAMVAAESTLVPVLQSSGTVSGIKEALVIAQTQGIIETIDVEIGDKVKRGDYLLSLKSNIQSSNYEQAKLQYDNAYLNLQAVERSFNAGGSSKSDLLRAQSTFNGSKAVFASARQAYDDNNLRSLINGTVAWKADGLEVGNILSPGSLVYKIVDLSAIKVNLSLGERQIGLVQQGGKAFVNASAACGNKWAEGEIVAVAGGSDATTGSYQVIINAENICPEKIKAGMTVKIRMETDGQKSYIIVPRSAVVFLSHKAHVFIEENGEAVAKEIEMGEEMGNRVEVISGIDPGERVIITGLTSLRSGDAVIITLKGNSSDIE